MQSFGAVHKNFHGSVNVRHRYGRLKQLGAADGKFTTAGAADKDPSLGMAEDERPLALRRQHGQHQDALAIGTSGEIGEFGEMAGVERQSGSLYFRLRKLPAGLEARCEKFKAIYAPACGGSIT